MRGIVPPARGAGHLTSTMVEVLAWVRDVTADIGGWTRRRPRVIPGDDADAPRTIPEWDADRRDGRWRGGGSAIASIPHPAPPEPADGDRGRDQGSTGGSTDSARRDPDVAW